MDDAALVVAKRELRKRMREARDRIPASERANASAAIVMRIAQLLLPRPPKRIALFAGIGSEVDLSGLEEIAVSLRVETYYPRVEDGRIAFRRALRADLTPGTWQIPEPPPGAPEGSGIDAMVVPGVAFDRACRRLGNGKGYYDRALAELKPAFTIGAAFEAQLVDAVPVSERDVTLDVVVTETEAIHRLKH